MVRSQFGSSVWLTTNRLGVAKPLVLELPGLRTVAAPPLDRSRLCSPWELGRRGAEAVLRRCLGSWWSSSPARPWPLVQALGRRRRLPQGGGGGRSLGARTAGMQGDVAPLVALRRVLWRCSSWGTFSSASTGWSCRAAVRGGSPPRAQRGSPARSSRSWSLEPPVGSASLRRQRPHGRQSRIAMRERLTMAPSSARFGTAGGGGPVPKAVQSGP